jgi:hypothetical protein
MTAGERTLRGQMDDHILDGKFRETTETCCRLSAGARDPPGLVSHVMHTAAPHPARPGAREAAAERRVPQRRRRPHEPWEPRRHAPGAAPGAGRAAPAARGGHLRRAAGPLPKQAALSSEQQDKIVTDDSVKQGWDAVAGVPRAETLRALEIDEDAARPV